MGISFEMLLMVLTRLTHNFFRDYGMGTICKPESSHSRQERETVIEVVQHMERYSSCRKEDSTFGGKEKIELAIKQSHDCGDQE